MNFSVNLDNSAAGWAGFFLLFSHQNLTPTLACAGWAPQGSLASAAPAPGRAAGWLCAGAGSQPPAGGGGGVDTRCQGLYLFCLLGFF